MSFILNDRTECARHPKNYDILTIQSAAYTFTGNTSTSSAFKFNGYQSCGHNGGSGVVDGYEASMPCKRRYTLSVRGKSQPNIDHTVLIADKVDFTTRPDTDSSLYSAKAIKSKSDGDVMLQPDSIRAKINQSRTAAA